MVLRHQDESLLLKELVTQKTALEVCVTSNVQTKGSGHWKNTLLRDFMMQASM